jgi:hypothetical protein
MDLCPFAQLLQFRSDFLWKLKALSRRLRLLENCGYGDKSLGLMGQTNICSLILRS